MSALYPCKAAVVKGEQMQAALSDSDNLDFPAMPVSCSDCVHAIPTRLHCHQGTISITRSRKVNRLCADFTAFESAAAGEPAARSEARTAGEAGKAEMFHGNVSRNYLYVLVTRKGSLKNETKRQSEEGLAREQSA